MHTATAATSSSDGITTHGTQCLYPSLLDGLDDDVDRMTKRKKQSWTSDDHAYYDADLNSHFCLDSCAASSDSSDAA